MKQKEVQIGMTCWTYIGQELAEVVVVDSYTNYENKLKYHVRRANERTILPKGRTAAALRPTNRRYL